MKFINKILYKLPIIGQRMKEKDRFDSILHPVVSSEKKQTAIEMIKWHEKRLESVSVNCTDYVYHKNAITYWESYLK